MRRTLRPTVDTYRDNGFPNEWVTHLNGTTSLFAEIDEAYNDTADFIKMWTGATADPVVVFKISSVPTPVLRTNHAIVLWAKYLAAGAGTTNLLVELREGYVSEGSQGTLIFSHAIFHTLITTSFQEFRFNGDGSAITDYSNLYFRVVGDVDNPAPGIDGLVISQLYFAVPGDGVLGSNVSQFPGSPIYGEVFSAGSVNGGAFGQLLNPEGSTAKLVVHELAFWGGGADGNTGLNRQWANAVHRSDYPFDVGAGGTIKTANQIRLDQNDATAIQGVLRAMNFTNEQYHNVVGQVGYEFEDINDTDADGLKPLRCQWLARPSTNAGDLPTWIRRPGSFAWTLMPGSALEIPWLDNGTGTTIRVIAVWDEIIL